MPPKDLKTFVTSLGNYNVNHAKDTLKRVFKERGLEIKDEESLVDANGLGGMTVLAETIPVFIEHIRKVAIDNDFAAVTDELSGISQLYQQVRMDTVPLMHDLANLAEAAVRLLPRLQEQVKAKRYRSAAKTTRRLGARVDEYRERLEKLRKPLKTLVERINKVKTDTEEEAKERAARKNKTKWIVIGVIGGVALAVGIGAIGYAAFVGANLGGAVAAEALAVGALNVLEVGAGEAAIGAALAEVHLAMGAVAAAEAAIGGALALALGAMGGGAGAAVLALIAYVGGDLGSGLEMLLALIIALLILVECELAAFEGVASAVRDLQTHQKGVVEDLEDEPEDEAEITELCQDIDTAVSKWRTVGERCEEYRKVITDVEQRMKKEMGKK